MAKGDETNGRTGDAKVGSESGPAPVGPPVPPTQPVPMPPPAPKTGQTRPAAPAAPTPPPPPRQRGKIAKTFQLYGQRLAVWLNRGFLGYLVAVIFGSAALLVVAKPHLVHDIWAAFVAVAVVTFIPPMVVKFRREAVVAIPHALAAGVAEYRAPASRRGGPLAALLGLVDVLLAVVEKLWTIFVGVIVGGLAYGLAELTSPLVAAIGFGAAAVAGGTWALRSTARARYAASHSK